MENPDMGEYIKGEIDVIRLSNGKFTVKTVAYNDDGTPFMRMPRFEPIRGISRYMCKRVLERCRLAGYDVQVKPSDARSLSL